MPPQPHSAMVFAAGLGTRMRPLSNDCPKPLIKVQNKALIDYTLDLIEDSGIKNAVVNVHYLAAQIENHLARRSNPQITISDERDNLLDTGGGLKKAAPLIGEDPVFAVNTDAIFSVRHGDNPCTKLVDAWRGVNTEALLLLVPTNNAIGYDGPGDFDINTDGSLSRRKAGTAQFVYSGLQIISPSLLDGTPDGPFSIRLLWEKAMRNGKFRGVRYDGDWIHVGDPKGLELANAYFGHS